MEPTLFDAPGAGSPGDRPADSEAGPLAETLRPRSLAEIVGQEAVAGPEAFLRRAIEDDRIPSLIFWGPPGCGKTTLARIIATETESRFLPFSAVTSGIKEVKAVMADSLRLRKAQGRRTVLFVDEIHRFNRAQQDAFLPYVEAGDIVLVGATTENPSFSLNAALLSRCRVVVLEPLSLEDLVTLLERALKDEDRGLGRLTLEADREALESIAQLASGDARKALNLLEASAVDLVGRTSPTTPAAAKLTAQAVQRVAQKKVLLYDKSGEEHFNLISALHKSLRDSDADAALYWLCRMLEAGEDPLYLARRMIRFASEDVGLADPQALPRALAARDAYQALGSPEGELALAQLTLYLALVPKSNGVYTAYKRTRKLIAERPADPVPKAIRNSPTKLMKEIGYGEGYVYAHDTEEGTAGLGCLPDSLAGTELYRPTDHGREKDFARRLQELRRLRSRLAQSPKRSP